MKHKEVVQKILGFHPDLGADYDGCDNYKFGDPEDECTGIATAIVADIDVIRKAAEINANLLIVHEPTFYSTPDFPDWRSGGRNEVYEEKCRLLEKNGITIWRNHDHMHAHRPDLIFEGVIKYWGWQDYLCEDDPFDVPFGYTFKLPQMRVDELGRLLCRKLKLNGLRYLGNDDALIRYAAIVGHLSGGFGDLPSPDPALHREYGTDLIKSMERGLDVIIPGEVIEWTTLSYVRDAVQLGKNKAVMNIGHFSMEELGMRYAEDWIKELVNHELPVNYIPSGDIFSFM